MNTSLLLLVAALVFFVDANPIRSPVEEKHFTFCDIYAELKELVDDTDDGIAMSQQQGVLRPVIFWRFIARYIVKRAVIAGAKKLMRSRLRKSLKK